MATAREVGPYLSRLRIEAGLAQKEVAELASMHPGVLSRIESGERPPTDDEVKRIVAALDTDDARQFGASISLPWAYLQRPPVGHPDMDLLWRGEECLAELAQVREKIGLGIDNNDPLQARLQARLRESEGEIKRVAALVRNLEHAIAFMGDIGVGKTSALCAILGLQVPRTPSGRHMEVLEVGNGRTTVCEVQVVQGPAYGVLVESLTDQEAEREVFEFADYLKRATGSTVTVNSGGGESSTVEPATGDPSFPGTTREISRCIRNMSRLTVPRLGASGQGDGVDPAMQLARNAQDSTALAGEIVSRMNLQQRRRREIWYSPDSGREPLVWLADMFRQVNNGRHLEFSIPRVIEVMVPGEILEEKTLKLRLVDTKGIDATVERADLDNHLRDPATVVALCTGFNDAPAISVQALLEQAQPSGIRNLDAKAMVLALVHPDQASGVKYDDGAEVETVEEGYALKADQVRMQLAVRDVKCAAVEFFNCREETPDRVKEALLKLVWNVRERHCQKLTEVVTRTSAMLANYEEEQVIADNREASRRLVGWLDDNRELPAFDLELEAGLISAIQRAHPSSVRASVRREGLWDNLNYNYQMGIGVQAMVDGVVGDRIRGFTEVATFTAGDLTAAKDLVDQAIRMMETGKVKLLDACRDFGGTIHTYDMKSDGPFWDSCDSEWGRGPGYRDRVLGHHDDWFGERTDGDGGLKSRVREFVEGEWNNLLNRVESILG